ncbi:hypothetical protein HU200_019315 [Digitaria exilis]|uniref:Uncharacterized protein n=1 Tax=Digitaria exilis TaxID=1010633 RepID=A0A835F2Y4_9POAL|nr:hypothetical protein HU200_019315 [Digitaria exilis]
MRDERFGGVQVTIWKEGSERRPRPMTATHPCVNALPLPEATTQLPPLQPRLAPHVYPIHPLRCRCLPRPTAPPASSGRTPAPRHASPAVWVGVSDGTAADPCVPSPPRAKGEEAISSPISMPCPPPPPFPRPASLQ